MTPTSLTSLTLKKYLAIFFLILGLGASGWWLWLHQQTAASTGHDEQAPGHQHGAADTHEKQESGKLGKHGGELQQQAGYTLETLWSERDEQAYLQLWLYQGERAIASQAIQLSARLERLDGAQQKLDFSATSDSYQSQQGIKSPHAFTLQLTLTLAQQSLSFNLQRDEGKLVLSPEQIQAAAISLEKAETGNLQSQLELPGEIKLNQDRTAHVVPRIAGVVESVHADLGQAVKKGQLLAIISSPAAAEQRSELQTAEKRLALAKNNFEREKRLWEQKVAAEQDYQQAAQVLSEAQIATSNARQKLAALGLNSSSARGLNRFELRAPFDGMVIEKHLSLGEVVKDDAAVFTISDLTQVWAEINITAKDLALVKTGADATVMASALNTSSRGKISYVGALLGEQSRSAKARLVLNNPDGAWRPGLFVTVSLTQPQTEAKVLSVLSEAVQQIEQKHVVFIQVPGGFLAQVVTPGRSDGKRVEILQGLKPDTVYAATGSFILKSELGKASAEHSH